jgi:hypothetical protein
MSSETHASLQEISTLLTQMLGSASDQVRLMPTLAQQVRQLPPPDSVLLSRPVFDRAGLWSYCGNFFNLGQEVTASQVIRIPEPSWIRGVDICVLPSLYFDQFPDPGVWLQAAEQRALLCRYGTNWRGLVDVDWRLTGKQGFIQDGHGDRDAPATQVSGDGEFSVPLDWRLDRDDGILVRCSNRVNRVLDPECNTYVERTLRWVAVIFWAEELDR